MTITEPTLVCTMGAQAMVSYGSSDGSVTVTGSGGTVAGDLHLLYGDNGQTTATATRLAAGSYTVTITDDNGMSRNTS